MNHSTKWLIIDVLFLVLLTASVSAFSQPALKNRTPLESYQFVESVCVSAGTYAGIVRYQKSNGVPFQDALKNMRESVARYTKENPEKDPGIIRLLSIIAESETYWGYSQEAEAYRLSSRLQEIRKHRCINEIGVQ
jgi:hypothetical protein